MRTIRRIGGRGRSSWRRRIRNHGERTTHKSTPPISTSSSYPHPSFLQSLQVSGPFASSLPPRLGGLRVRVGLGHTHVSCASALFLLIPSPSQPLPASHSTRCFFDTSFFRHECFCRPSPPPPPPRSVLPTPCCRCDRRPPIESSLSTRSAPDSSDEQRASAGPQAGRRGSEDPHRAQAHLPFI